MNPDATVLALKAEQDLFFACLDAGPGQRAALLAAAGPALAARVERLLQFEAATAADDGLAPPTGAAREIGPFRVIKRLGEGGMGEVFLAAQRSPVRRLLAVKVIRGGLADREVLARFEAERQALALMAHPGIARMVEAGEISPGRPYFAMEYVPGPPLTQYCNERRLSIEDRIRLFVRVCAAVQHAHQKGVIHRDLKPGNILVAEVDGRPQPVVIDFGVAKALGGRLTEATLHTGAGSIVGTPDYMSPEQAFGDHGDVDTRADVYALGAVLYELLTGTTPHRLAERKAGLAAMQDTLRHADPQRPSVRATGPAGEPGHAGRCGMDDPRDLAALLADELDWIVLKALDRDRSRRYGSASALESDLGRFLAGEGVEARPPTLGYALRKLLRRHALAATVVGTVVIASLALAVVMASYARALREERDRTRVEAQRSAEVTRFVTALFERGDPESGQGGNLSARDLLRDAARRLRDNPAGDPQLQARLLESAARLHFGLGLFEDGVPLAAEAVGLLDGPSPEARRAAARARVGLADLLYEAGRVDEAAAELETAHQVLAAAPAAEAELLDELELDLAKLANRRAELDVARRWVESVRRRLDARGVLAGDLRARMLSRSARLWREQGRLDLAASEAQAAVDSLRPVPGLSRSQVLVHTQLGLIQLEAGQAVDAEATFRRLAERAEREHGGDHPTVGIALSNLGRSLLAQGRPADALAPLSRAAQVHSTAKGPQHPDSLAIQVAIARAHLGTGDPARSEGMLSRLLPEVRAAAGARHPLVADALAVRAEALHSRGDGGAATTDARDALAIYDESGRGNAIPALALSVLLAGWLRDAGAIDEARAVAARRLSAARALPQDHALLRELRLLAERIDRVPSR